MAIPEFRLLGLVLLRVSFFVIGSALAVAGWYLYTEHRTVVLFGFSWEIGYLVATNITPTAFESVVGTLLGSLLVVKLVHRWPRIERVLISALGVLAGYSSFIVGVVLVIQILRYSNWADPIPTGTWFFFIMVAGGVLGGVITWLKPNSPAIIVFVTAGVGASYVNSALTTSTFAPLLRSFGPLIGVFIGGLLVQSVTVGDLNLPYRVQFES